MSRSNKPCSIGATKGVRGIQRRVDRYKERMENIILSLPKTPASSVPLSTNSPSPHQLSSTVTPGTAPGSRKSCGIDEICIVTKAREDALDKIPAWLDRGKTASTLSKRKKRPTAEVNRDNFTERAENDYRDEKFKGVWKDATNEYHANITGTKKGKHGFGAAAVASKYNKRLSFPNDRKIRAQTLIDSVARGEFGMRQMN